MITCVKVSTLKERKEALSTIPFFKKQIQINTKRHFYIFDIEFNKVEEYIKQTNKRKNQQTN